MSILTKVINTVRKIGLEIRNNTPVGMLMPYSGKIIPTGWLLCDGSLISRSEYSRLFTAIGTLYGEGDGSTTFALPDYRDKTIWGGVANDVGTVKDAGLPNIKGEFSIEGNNVHCQSRLESGCFSIYYKPSMTLNYTNAPSGVSNHRPGMTNLDASRSSPIYGNSETVQPPAIVAMMLIKY